MPTRIRELLTSWGGDQVKHYNILEVWKLALLHFMWCLWRKQNARNFENTFIKTWLVELEKIIFKSFYTWIAAHNRVFFFFFPPSFSIFLILCSFSTEQGRILLDVCLAAALFNEMKLILFYKKKGVFLLIRDKLKHYCNTNH